MRWQSLEELRFAPEWSKKAKQLNGHARMVNALEKIRLARHWKGQEYSCVGVAWGCSAKELKSYEELREARA